MEKNELLAKIVELIANLNPDTSHIPTRLALKDLYEKTLANEVL